MKDFKRVIDAVKVNGVEAVSEANSGHPGIVLGAASTLVTLFLKEMVVNPDCPCFFNRDRFVLSAGHGSALLYALLGAMQVKGVDIKNLKSFRQYKSKFAGHPERGEVPLVEVSTGPLGQGVATSVGIALAEARLNSMYKLRDGSSVVDHYTYCLFGDGCFQEGIFHEALSVASYYKLNKLVLIYDSNDIQLDGPISNSECIKNKEYFESFGVDYQIVYNGEDCDEIERALKKARLSDRVSVIEVKTVIGLHTSVANSADAHGMPLKEKDVNLLRSTLGYGVEKFTYEDSVYRAFDEMRERGKIKQQLFNSKLKSLEIDNPEKALELKNIISGKANLDCLDKIKELKFTKEAGRVMIGKALQEVMKSNNHVVALIADLSKSTKVYKYDDKNASKHNYLSANYNLGVREFAMQAISNGIVAHGGHLSVCSTFLVFVDYMKAALRVGAISKLNTLSVFTHDSVTVGEDGPTHQPVEQLWSMRLMPDVYVSRPCNVSEIASTFKLWLDGNKKCPVICCGSRLAFDVYESNSPDVDKGAYVVYETNNKQSDLTLLSTGSEVPLSVEIAKELHKAGINVNVVSMWCVNLFDEQDEEYKTKLMGNNLVVSIEYGSTAPWAKYADVNLGIDHYGASGKPVEYLKDWSLDVQGIKDIILDILNKDI